MSKQQFDYFSTKICWECVNLFFPVIYILGILQKFYANGIKGSLFCSKKMKSIDFYSFYTSSKLLMPMSCCIHVQYFF